MEVYMPTCAYTYFSTNIWSDTTSSSQSYTIYFNWLTAYLPPSPSPSPSPSHTLSLPLDHKETNASKAILCHVLLLYHAMLCYARYVCNVYAAPHKTLHPLYTLHTLLRVFYVSYVRCVLYYVLYVRYLCAIHKIPIPNPAYCCFFIVYTTFYSEIYGWRWC